MPDSRARNISNSIDCAHYCYAQAPMSTAFSTKFDEDSSREVSLDELSLLPPLGRTGSVACPHCNMMFPVSDLNRHSQLMHSTFGEYKPTAAAIAASSDPIAESAAAAITQQAAVVLVQAAPADEPTIGNSAVSQMDAEFVEYDPATGFVLHTVTDTDTLVGLALKYHVSTQDIRSHNKLFGDNVFSRKKLIMPTKVAPARVIEELAQASANARAGIVSPQERVRKQLTLIESFRITMGCTEQEAKYYMQVSNYSMDKACRLLKEDRDWEKDRRARMLQKEICVVQ
eukprot:TRINITY_DN2123_c0_g1_i1.p1 TRINITY_DN2123_c0_g1~~TRINITY_DN2123_c0_g1_i1.p1  ORF type:complete len:286 (-),score=51.52 TRINITY_DN2123_c0_g1_i1:709-1566(-)